MEWCLLFCGVRRSGVVVDGGKAGKKGVVGGEGRKRKSRGLVSLNPDEHIQQQQQTCKTYFGPRLAKVRLTG